MSATTVSNWVQLASTTEEKQSRSAKQVWTNLPEFSQATQLSVFVFFFIPFFYLISAAFYRSSRSTYHVKQWVWWWHWFLQHCWRRRTRIWLHLGACARAEFWAQNQSRRRTLSPAGARDKIMLKEFFWFTMNEGPSTGKIKMSTEKQICLTTLMVTDETCAVRQKRELFWCCYWWVSCM